MFAWLLAGVALGILLSSLIRRIPDSSLAELTYITVLSTWKHWRQKRKASMPAPAGEPRIEARGWRAAAGRFNLF